MKLLPLLLLLAASASAQLPRVHDPSTIAQDKGRFYVFSTGRGIPFFSSADLKTWRSEGNIFEQIPDPVHAAVPLNSGSDVWAPDIIHLGKQFFLFYSVSKWNSFASAVAVATSPTLDPHDPAYHWTDRGVVVRSDGVEDLNAIDPGVVQAPDGTLWICYGSYHGPIQLIQLDPRTGLRISPASPVSVIATHSEASDIITHDGWFYLFVNHGSCCQHDKSTYHINVGRSHKVTGPYLDRAGKPLTEVPGEPFLATDLNAAPGKIGPGHFGRFTLPNGTEMFSIHFESDSNNFGRSTLAIRPLTWTKDGWPQSGPPTPDDAYPPYPTPTPPTPKPATP